MTMIRSVTAVEPRRWVIKSEVLPLGYLRKFPVQGPLSAHGIEADWWVHRG